jgi:hypothetical protein
VGLACLLISLISDENSNAAKEYVFRNVSCTPRCFFEQRPEKIWSSYFLCVLFKEARTRTEKARHFFCA